MKPACKVIVQACLFLLGLSSSLQATEFLAIPGRRDMVYDDTRHTLYVTAGSSLVRYDVQARQFLSPIVLGGGNANLRGIDISADGTRLAVADGRSTSTSNWIFQVNLNDLSINQVTFTKSISLEAGTFMPAFGADGRILVSSSFAGSGNVPLRLYNPSSGTTTTVASVRQSSMLTASADRSAIGIAEANSSAGPLNRYDVATGALQEWNQGSWFTFEMGVNHNGSQFAVPTYGGMYVYDNAFHQVGRIGQSATNGPIGVVYAPNQDIIYTSWYDWSNVAASREIRAFSATTLQQIGTFDAYGPAEGKFDWVGNGSLVEGRLRVSADGGYLFATVDGGVTIIRVPEPGAFALAAIGLAGLATLGWRRRRA